MLYAKLRYVGLKTSLAAFLNVDVQFSFTNIAYLIVAVKTGNSRFYQISISQSE